MARPDLSYLKSVLLFLIGVPLGFLTGLSAVSSSVFGVPAVRRLLGLRPARAVGVGLILTFFAALAGILSYAQHRQVHFGLALLLFVFQTAGAVLAERLVAANPKLERLTALWGTLIILGGLTMLANALGYWHAPVLLLSPLSFGFAAAGLAIVVGLVSRISGLGGVLIVPAAIYGLGLTPHVAQGTALVVLTLASLPGVLAHARRGEIEPQAGTWLSAGAILGSLSGALVAAGSLTDHALLLLFGLLLFVLGLMVIARKPTPLVPRDPPEAGR